ncbi:MAG: Hsp20/alpha crystallin family protein, partial [Pleurocapsa sp.]
MAIVRYNPWSELDSVQRQINRMFNEVLPTTNITESNTFFKYPAAELIEAEEYLTLKLEVPGINSEDIEIEATAKSISI